MEAQTVIDTALAAGAANLGAPEAAKIFRDNVANSIRCNVQLTAGQKSLLRRCVNFPVIFTGGKVVTNDHPVLVACRDLIRDIFEREYKISVASERVLVVGAAAREIRRYNANPHIHYHVYGKENKDYDRVVRPALSDICKMLKTKASKTNKSVFLNPPGFNDTTTTRGVVKRYWKAQELFADYCLTHNLPNTIHTTYIEANTLVLEDSFYNFSVDDYIDMFDKTGAQIAYGYGLLPLELIFPEMPENPLYSVREFTDSFGVSKTAIVFRHGYSNGYVHDTESWKTLLRSPVLANSSKKISLAVEITSRVGPMVTFKIYRCLHPERLVRCFELDDRQRYVKLLDIKKCINKVTGRVNSPLKYFSMAEGEYLDVVNYLMSLDPKSMTYQNTIAYIRRRMGGMSLITKELIEAWVLPKRLVTDAALTIFLDVKLRMDMNEKAVRNINVGSIYEKFVSFFITAGRTVMYPLAMLYDWLIAGHLVDKLVLDGLDQSYQYDLTCPVRVDKDTDINVGLYLDNPFEGDIPTCPVCRLLFGKMGKQIIDCKHIETEPTTVEMTDAQITEMRNVLIASDEDPAGLAAVKKRCHDNMPTSGFKINVNFRYIKAGPGCGKSYAIRQMADENDLVLAPFTKLRPDYVDLTAEDGSKYDLIFKTTHRAMESRGCRRIFVDEFTSFPYEYLCCIAYLNGAEEIYLVGDDKQTRVQEPTEGLYIGNWLDLTKLSVHELLVNFRNPQDTVALLNKVYGYNMRAFSQIEKSIEFVKNEDLPANLVAAKMGFSKASAKLNTEEEKNTVRANQGGTHKQVVLYCTIADGQTPSVEALQIVGLSRHTEKLYIVTDGCDEVVKLQQKLALDADFYEHMQTWLTFPNETLKEVVQEDKIVEAVIRPTQPPKDMYLMYDTFIPTAALDENTTSMNLVSSTKIPDEFVTGNFNPDLLLMPVNKRKHPINLKLNYYAYSSGIGNHFSAKSPVQVLQVLQARYFNRQPTFELGHKQRCLATAMVNEWFKDNVQKDFKKNLFDDAEVQSVINDFLKKVCSSNYQSSFRGGGGLDNPDGRTIRFNLKGIFKPKHGEPDVFKAGQGISAWSIDACAMFCSIFRILTRLISKTECNHVLTDGYMTEFEFIQTAQNLLQAVSDIANFGTTDGITFDANQNAWTQLIERIYWTTYGVPEEFLDMYYSFRTNYKIISSVAIGFAGTQKTSGEPGTLANNGIVSKVYSNWVIVGDGMHVTIYKGDDFSKKQLNIRVHEERKKQVEACCALGLRVNISKSTDFCGLTFGGGKLFPSIPRKVNKISAHRFKDYKHFCEYQDSLRNWVKLVTQLNEMEVVALNADHAGTTVEEMQNAFDAVKSMSHIDKEQFLSSFKFTTEVGVIPIVNSRGFDVVTQE